MPEIVTDWRSLKAGQFVRLSCGCEGLVYAVYPTGLEESERGFQVAYSKWMCARRQDLEATYRSKYGPYTNFFNYSLCDQALPIEIIEKPAWWDELLKGTEFVPRGVGGK